MADQSELNVGLRIRKLREQHGFSLRTLAERSGLSINAISLIERGENSPTVSSLHVLASALGVKITDFFEDANEQAVVYVKRNRRLVSQANGVVMESLGIGLRNQQMEPFLATIDPPMVSANELIAHPGQEFVYCVAGEIEYQIGSQSYLLMPGDSLLFEAAQPHCFRGLGELPATILLVFQVTEGSHLARQYHLDT